MRSTGAIKKKREIKKQKKDSNSWENVVKEMTEIDEGEKWRFVESKYKEIHEDLLRVSEILKTHQKQNTDLELEKNNLSKELTRIMMAKSKMETLARELQKQNKDMKELNYNKLREEEERRKVVASSFTDKLNSLNTLMDENREHSEKLKDENLNMRGRLKELYDQFEEREEHVLNMNKQIELQAKLSDTQFKKLEMEFATEKELWSKEKSMLIARYEQTEKTNEFLEDNVKSLQEHLITYKDQFREFENTIKHSTSIYSNFKDDMVKLQQCNKELEKDRLQWKARSQSQLDTIVRMTEANEAFKQEIYGLERKRSALEKLCRQLQLERMDYLKKFEDLSALASTSFPGITGADGGDASEKRVADSQIQTDFPLVIRRLPLRPPANAPDDRLYIDLEKGKFIRFKIGISHIHEKYLEQLEKVINEDCSTSSEPDNSRNQNEIIIKPLKNLRVEDCYIFLDFGVISDEKIAVVANLGSLNVDQLSDDLQKDLNISDKENPPLPKIRIKPIATMLPKADSDEQEEK